MLKYSRINVKHDRNGKRKQATQNIKSGKLITTVTSTMLEVPIV
jgi:hypothetical protein